MRRRYMFLGVAAAAALALNFARRPRRMQGEVAFVSGGSRGLGLEIAREIGRRGGTPVLYARSEAEIARALRMLQSDGIAAWGVAGDVRDPVQTAAAIDETVRRYGRLDMLINAAGIVNVGPLESMRREDYEDALATHFWGAFNTIEAALPHFRARGCGSIANVSSIGGRIGVPHLLPYSASKFALAGFSEGLRAELAREHISVTTIYPGLMRTGSPRNADFRGNAGAEYAWFKIADTLPGISVSARRAARAIVDAMLRGAATLTISLPARLGEIAHGVAPDAVVRALSMTAMLLPRSDGRSDGSKKGFEVENALTRSALTVLGRVAERDLNQDAGAKRSRTLAGSH